MKHSIAPDRDPGRLKLINNVTAGGLIGVFPEARQTVETALEEALSGAATPQEAMDKAAQSVTQAIQDYNETTGQ
jgi:sn-glycerol 3-phosphate transport system substrate-binding protein